MQPPSAVRCLENSGFSGRGQLCGDVKDLTSFPDTSQVDAHFHCHDKVMRGFSWVVLFPEVCRWNDFYSWKAGTEADSSDSFTWAAASTLLRPSPSPLSLPPHSHFVLLNVDPMILSHQHINYLPPCSSQWIGIIIPQYGSIMHLDSHLHHPVVGEIFVQLWKLVPMLATNQWAGSIISSVTSAGGNCFSY